VPVVVKIAGIPWFTAMEKGIKETGKDTGLNAYMVGPNSADPAQQVRLVEDLIAKKVKVIAVVPNDAKALEPVFKRAQAAGIPIITHESPDQQGNTWDIEMISHSLLPSFLCSASHRKALRVCRPCQLIHAQTPEVASFRRRINEIDCPVVGTMLMQIAPYTAAPQRFQWRIKRMHFVAGIRRSPLAV
jgi:hypothetical protein